MATEPTKLPEWASGGSAAITEPSESKKDLGWVAEKPPHQWMNWLFNLIYQWIEYFKLIGIPVGGVIWWHKDLSGVPSLTGQWVECNGQTLSDAESPLNGQVIPDINNAARFIRGATTSGSTQANQNKQHTHVQNSHNHTQDSHAHTATTTSTLTWPAYISYLSNPSSIVPVGSTGTGAALRKDAAYDGETLAVINSASIVSSTTVNSTTATNQAATATNQNEGGSEARPDNIGLVAIMRVK